MEIRLQGRGQQRVEPGGLVAALTPDEHQDHLVYHLVVDPSRHHAHQPLAQPEVEQQLLLGAATYRDRHRQVEDRVALAVPRRQAVQVAEKRVVERREIGIDHAPDVLLACLLHAADHAPESINEPVVGDMPLGGRAPLVERRRTRRIDHLQGLELILLRHPELRLACHHVIPQQQVVLQELPNVLRRGVSLLPALLVLLSLAVFS